MRKVFRFAFDNSLFLIGGTLMALLWANLGYSSYAPVSHALHFLVNDVLMALFFALAAKEVWEAMLPGGVLSSPRRAAMPLMATAGGVIAPAGLYALGALLLDPDLLRGWAIPCATDIAFSYLVTRALFGGSHPAIPFLLLLAIADDGIGLFILAVFYPQGEVRLGLFSLMVVLAVGLGILFHKVFKFHSFWPYLLGPGALSWFGFYLGGLHPALGLVPIIPTLPHAHTDLGIFAREELGRHDTLSELEHWWKKPVELILGLFGFVNAGVPFSSVGIGTWLVLLGLLIGKPLGIVGFTLLGSLARLQFPEGMNFKDLFVMSCAASIGFTVSLFIATVAFPGGEALNAVKMGAVLSFGGAILTVIAAKVLQIKRLPDRR